MVTVQEVHDDLVIMQIKNANFKALQLFNNVRWKTYLSGFRS